MDDLAKCVDAFSVVREERLAATRRAALQGQCEAVSARSCARRNRRRCLTACGAGVRAPHLTHATARACCGPPQLSAERSALAQRVAQLSLLLPEEDGEFRRLRAELARLERDCDAHFARYQVEMRAKAASDELARELRGALLCKHDGAVHRRGKAARMTSSEEGGVRRCGPPGARRCHRRGARPATLPASLPSLRAAAARLTWLESQLTTFGIAIMSPAAPGGPPLLTAARARAALKPDGTVVLEADPDRAPSGGGGGGDDDTRDQRQGDGTVGPPGEAAGQQATAAATGGAPPHVTPEAILAAVEYLREKGELPPSSGIGRFPSRQAVSPGRGARRPFQMLC